MISIQGKPHKTPERKAQPVKRPHSMQTYHVIF